MSLWSNWKMLGLAGAVIVSGWCYAVSPVTFVEKERFTGVMRDDLSLIGGTKGSNYIISSFQKRGEIFLMTMMFVCQTKDGSTEFENKVPNAQPKKLFSGVQDGEWRWVTSSQWKYLELKRTIAMGDYPGYKITYEYKITKPFQAQRLYLHFSMPPRDYTNTGYIENGVMQFRPVKKAEWFGIYRDRKFPYITFGGEKGSGVMIMAADRASWDQLPGHLLYSSGAKQYYSTEFMYHQGDKMTPGMTGKFSFYVIPVTGSKMAIEAADIYAKLQNKIK